MKDKLYMVKCFAHDEWKDKDVFELQCGDIFVHSGQTLVVTESAYMKDGKPHIPASLYDSGPIIIDLSKEKEAITMVMDFVGSSAHSFEDGTMQICSFEDGLTNVYSPRLPTLELNEFCQKHIDHYQQFFDEHFDKIENGASITMDRFW